MTERSAETRMALLEDNYTKVNATMEKLESKIDNLKSSIDTLPEKLDERYANKDTEITVKKLQWLVVSAVVVALLGLVIFKQ